MHRVLRAGPFGIRLVMTGVATVALIAIAIQAVRTGEWILLLAVAGSLSIVGALAWGAWVRYRSM